MTAPQPRCDRWHARIDLFGCRLPLLTLDPFRTRFGFGLPEVRHLSYHSYTCFYYAFIIFAVKSSLFVFRLREHQIYVQRVRVHFQLVWSDQ